MNGTFKSGDFLKLQKIRFDELHLGDVIVYTSKQRNKQTETLVHRIVKVSNKESTARGDNNPKNDEKPVTEKNLIGRVTHYEYQGKIHKVWNGSLGMMRARILHGRLHIIRTAKLCLKKPYRILKKTGIVPRLWRPEIEVIYFKTQDGPLVKYVHKGKTVASFLYETNRWWFRRPYDFIIERRRNLH